jgi:hypothetical protein
MELDALTTMLLLISLLTKMTRRRRKVDPPRKKDSLFMRSIDPYTCNHVIVDYGIT